MLFLSTTLRLGLLLLKGACFLLQLSFALVSNSRKGMLSLSTILRLGLYLMKGDAFSYNYTLPWSLPPERECFLLAFSIQALGMIGLSPPGIHTTIRIWIEGGGRGNGPRTFILSLG
jgi:hypothetical protein